LCGSTYIQTAPPSVVYNIVHMYGVVINVPWGQIFLYKTHNIVVLERFENSILCDVKGTL